MKHIFFTLFFFAVATHFATAQLSIELENPNLKVCYNADIDEIALAFDTAGGPTHYKIISDNFMNMDAFEELPEGDILIPIDLGTLPAGSIYYASIVVATTGGIGIMTSDPVYFSLTIYEVFLPGTISGGTTTICAGTPAPTITGTNATGGDGNITYQWRKGGAPIDNSNFSTYTPTDVGVYTRFAKDNSCNTTLTLSPGTFTLGHYAAFNPGGISITGQTICSGGTPGIINSSSNPSGGNGGYTYRWRCNGNLINGATEISYTPNPATYGITGTYHFTREVNSNCTPTFVPSVGVWTLTVLPTFSAGAISTTPQTVCIGASAAPIGSVTNASGGNSNIIYQWKRGTTVLPSSDSPTYTPTETGTYTREARDTQCNTTFAASTGSCVVTFTTAFTAGKIATTGESVCKSALPSQIGSTEAPQGGNSPYAYRWRCNGVIISGATGITYTPAAQTQAGTYYYTREAKDNGCVTDYVASEGAWILTVLTDFNAGEIHSGEQVLCAGAQPDMIFSVKDASGGDGNISYQWKCNGDVIAGATNASYTPQPQTIEGNYIFTREAKDNKCSKEWSASANSFTLIITGTIETPEKPKGEATLCQGDESSEYSVTPIAAVENYLWELYPDGAGTVFGSGNSVFVYWKPDYKGDATLKVKALSSCGESSFSTALNITLKEPPQISFIHAPNPVCGNQKGLVYEIEPINNAIYEWSMDADKGEIIKTENKAIVNWKRTESAATTAITVKVTAGNCAATQVQSIAIFDGNAPDLNEIVAKTNAQGIPYVLIYPNPAEEYVFQWYEDGVAIPEATEQFFYPPNYENRKLEKGVNYQVFVAEIHSAACGSFTEDYILSAKDLAPENNNHISVFPNPVTNHSFSVSFNKALLNEKGDDYRLMIYSSFGEKVWEQKINSLEDINFSKPLAKGLYLITLIVDNKQYTEKIIIQ